MTEFRVEAVRIGQITKHTNADSLSIVTVHDGYPCIIKTTDFAEGDLAVYVPIDALVPVSRPEFAFLDAGKGRTHERIKARKLRGVFSMGLLVKAPPGVKEGADCRQMLEVEKWEPPAEREPGQPRFEGTRKPKPLETARFERISGWMLAVACVALTACVFVLGWNGLIAGAAQLAAICARLMLVSWNRKRCMAPNYPTYDIEGIRRYMHILQDGEEVWISEKIHGCNGSWYHTGKRFWTKSRTLFRRDPGNVWLAAAEKYGLKEKLAKHPGIVLFGEVYGSVQDLSYGVPKSEGVRMAAFDAMDIATRKFMSVDEFRSFCAELDIPMVPTLYRGPWSSGLLKMAEGPSTMPGANHVREGIVIKPSVDRHDNRIGRVILKLAGEGYLLRKEAA